LVTDAPELRPALNYSHYQVGSFAGQNNLIKEGIIDALKNSTTKWRTTEDGIKEMAINLVLKIKNFITWKDNPTGFCVNINYRDESRLD
jgi:hypothetical protein